MSGTGVEVSIVIPSFNRAASVTELVRWLIRNECQSIPIEIIVVLDGSTDDSATRLREVGASPNIDVRIVEQANSGRAAARNAGIAQSLGHILLFLDDDVIPDAPLVALHLRAQESLDLVLGGIRHGDVDGDSPLMRATGSEFFASRHERLQRQDLPIPATEVFAGHLSVAAERARAVGGFDEAFTGYGCEDWDFGQRVIDQGARVGYLAEAMVAHHSRMTRRRWLRDAREEAVSQLLLIDKHPSLAADTDIGGLYSSSLPGRIAAHLALYVPWLGKWVGAAFFELAEGAHFLRLETPARRLLAHSYRAAYWSSLASKIGSARAVRRRVEFHARVLCYHRVTDAPNPKLAEWSVTPRQLEEHVRFLARQGYTAVTCSELVRRFTAGEATERLIAITFDDGYEDTVTVAAPILSRAGFVATVFAVSGLLGKKAEWDGAFGGEMAPLATAEQLNSLAGAGWEIGHHTATHPDLTTVPDERLDDEMIESWDTLRRLISAPVRTFAYPYAAYDARVTRAAFSCEYDAAFGIGSRWASPQSRTEAIERVFVLNHHSLLDLRLLLWIGLDRRELIRHVITTPIRLARGRPPANV